MKNQKIFIDDLLRRHRDEAEVEINDERIRFENGENKYLISFDEGGIRIYKTNISANDVITVIPQSSNVIRVI